MQKQVKIKLENLVKIYTTENGKKVRVLDNINTEIFDNEFVAILGPSGCGKTTLLFIIAGLEPITSGKVMLDNELIKGPSRKRGVVFQETAVFPWRKVVRNVEYGLELQRVDKKQRRKIAMKYLEMMGLQEFANSYPKELSGGMKKRLALATVYANNPEVLLMDEPFSAIDYPTKCNLQMELLKIWRQERKTTIFVTHDVEEALFLADRIFILKDKKFVIVYENTFERPRKNNLRDEVNFLEKKKYLKSYYL